MAALLGLVVLLGAGSHYLRACSCGEIAGKILVFYTCTYSGLDGCKCYCEYIPEA